MLAACEQPVTFTVFCNKWKKISKTLWHVRTTRVMIWQYTIIVYMSYKPDDSQLNVLYGTIKERLSKKQQIANNKKLPMIKEDVEWVLEVSVKWRLSSVLTMRKRPTFSRANSNRSTLKYWSLVIRSVGLDTSDKSMVSCRCSELSSDSPTLDSFWKHRQMYNI